MSDLSDTATQAIDPEILEERTRQEELRQRGQVSLDEIGDLMGEDDIESVDQTRQLDPKDLEGSEA